MNSWPTAPYWSWATKLTGQVPPQRTSWGKFSGCTDKRQGREPCPALSCMEDHSSYVCAPFWRDKATVKDSVGSPNIWTRGLTTDLVSNNADNDFIPKSKTSSSTIGYILFFLCLSTKLSFFKYTNKLLFKTIKWCICTIQYTPIEISPFYLISQTSWKSHSLITLRLSTSAFVWEQDYSYSNLISRQCEWRNDRNVVNSWNTEDDL